MIANVMLILNEDINFTGFEGKKDCMMDPYYINMHWHMSQLILLHVN